MSVTIPTLIFLPASAVAAGWLSELELSLSSSPHAATVPMQSARTAISRSRIHFVFTERNPPLVMLFHPTPDARQTSGTPGSSLLISR